MLQLRLAGSDILDELSGKDNVPELRAGGDLPGTEELRRREQDIKGAGQQGKDQRQKKNEQQFKGANTKYFH